jgi:hypothetical protein
MDKIKLLIALKKEDTLKRYLNDVKHNGMDLQFIPHDEQTYEICKSAILQNQKAYEHINPNIKNFKFWLVSKSNIFKFLL